MAIKKSELYSSIWASCDELRGGMDASQYKDYVLVLLFIKYISDKYAGVKYAPIDIPAGASFADMVKLKGKSSIGDDINKKIIGPLVKANTSLAGTIDVANFNDPDKLGDGKDMVDRLTKLIAIFEGSALDFSKNKAEGDDILGDAYEYLMRHFATESGKSKGQFYTPSEVSRVIAKIIGVKHDTSRDTTVYDPTCGSGSLLLKLSDETEHGLSIYGQENDMATAALARMNMVLHNNPTAVSTIKKQNTLAAPQFLDDKGNLKLFDFIVANPPFSYKSWTNGLTPASDVYGRFKEYGVPPQKNGDYAFLLHIIRSLKSTGKGAVILPHGVLFRGNVEAEIRKKIIEKGYIKGVIGLPPNLFYGTGIPACIIVLDKENSTGRKGIFMIDASRGFVKDGNKNRLRAQDIHRIVDAFNKTIEVEKYSRMVPYSEIEKNEYNLNIPRYIDAQEEEDLQNIEAHLKGGIPEHDIERLGEYWEVYPALKKTLFKNLDKKLDKNPGRKGFYSINIEKEKIREAIFSHDEFKTYARQIESVFGKWKKDTAVNLKRIKLHDKPKQIIFEISENLLAAFSKIALINKYDIYQHLMSYWEETMQDDAYLIVQNENGWEAKPERILVKNKKGKEEDKGWKCDLVPKEYMVNRYFADEKKEIESLESEIESLKAKMEELEEENSGSEESGEADVFEECRGGKSISKAAIEKYLKQIKNDKDLANERKIIEQYKELLEKEAEAKKKFKEAEAKLDQAVYQKYSALSEDEVKTLVVDDKWLTRLENDIHSEMEKISQRLAVRINELAERYEFTLPQLKTKVSDLEMKVVSHLKQMGFEI